MSSCSKQGGRLARALTAHSVADSQLPLAAAKGAAGGRGATVAVRDLAVGERRPHFRGWVCEGEEAGDGQKTLIYSFVARGTTILAEYTEFKGNFTEIASQCLQRLPASYDKFTYSSDGHTFNFLVDNGYSYCIVAVESIGRQIPMAFLERIKEDFTKKYGGGKAATALAYSLNREFGPKLKEQMQYCMEHPDEISRLAKVQAQVSQVKEVMMENIEKVASSSFRTSEPLSTGLIGKKFAKIKYEKGILSCIKRNVDLDALCLVPHDIVGKNAEFIS
ncbi:Vesicle-associated membrane protein 725 [Platanthera guangdongensis]|uniref:Vesicle-associated membrane protein 725 n=1 Tax=Platanthera guangdongensis TaxID=2320717 RepID=A0ABR2MBQ8_9ASPA